MGIIKKTVKTVGKTIGTTALVVTGVSSTILKTAADTVGFELGSEAFECTKNGSFKGIRKMWSKNLDKPLDKLESATEMVSFRSARDGYLNKANASKKKAELYRRNGDEANYQSCMAEYERCMDKYRDLQSEYRGRCLNR